MFTVALTSTVPTACGGDLTSHTVVDVQLTVAAFGDPNLKIVAPGAVRKPAPVTVTGVPPALGPVFGVRPVMMGTNVNWSADDVALVPFGVVTVTSTVPATSAGETAVIDVADFTLKLLALIWPNLTAVAPVKLLPVMATDVPPVTRPLTGFSLVTLGGCRVANVLSLPNPVPPAFVATIRKWYDVLGLRPVAIAETATGLSPDPGRDEHGTLDP